jgi:hypothetical protein
LWRFLDELSRAKDVPSFVEQGGFDAVISAAAAADAAAAATDAAAAARDDYNDDGAEIDQEFTAMSP